MIGDATAMGAISIVNAIAGGNGGTVAVMLPTRAKVEIDRGVGGWRVTANGDPADPSLATRSIRCAMGLLKEDPAAYSGSVETSSAAPVGVGLKTSSSASIAIILAVLSAFGEKDLDEGGVLQCSSASSIAVGASLTGALDDAASCLRGGLNLTDNSANKILRSGHLRRRMRILIRVPNAPSRRRAVEPRYVRRFSAAAGSIFSMALGGKTWNAMTLNGLLYCSIYGYPPHHAIQAIAAGALGAGLSGTGPAVAAVFEDEAGLKRLAGKWGKEKGVRLITTETTNRGAVFGR